MERRPRLTCPSPAPRPPPPRHLQDEHAGGLLKPHAWPLASPSKSTAPGKQPAFYYGVLPSLRTVSMTQAVLLAAFAAAAAAIALSGATTLGLLAFGR